MGPVSVPANVSALSFLDTRSILSYLSEYRERYQRWTGHIMQMIGQNNDFLN